MLKVTVTGDRIGEGKTTASAVIYRALRDAGYFPVLEGEIGRTVLASKRFVERAAQITEKRDDGVWLEPRAITLIEVASDNVTGTNNGEA